MGDDLIFVVLAEAPDLARRLNDPDDDMVCLDIARALRELDPTAYYDLPLDPTPSSAPAGSQGKIQDMMSRFARYQLTRPGDSPADPFDLGKEITTKGGKRVGSFGNGSKKRRGVRRG